MATNPFQFFRTVLAPNVQRFAHNTLIPNLLEFLTLSPGRIAQNLLTGFAVQKFDGFQNPVPIVKPCPILIPTPCALAHRTDEDVDNAFWVVCLPVLIISLTISIFLMLVCLIRYKIMKHTYNHLKKTSKREYDNLKASSDELFARFNLFVELEHRYPTIFANNLDMAPKIDNMMHGFNFYTDLVTTFPQVFTRDFTVVKDRINDLVTTSGHWDTLLAEFPVIFDDPSAMTNRLKGVLATEGFYKYLCKDFSEIISRNSKETCQQLQAATKTKQQWDALQKVVQKVVPHAGSNGQPVRQKAHTLVQSGVQHRLLEASFPVLFQGDHNAKCKRLQNLIDKAKQYDDAEQAPKKHTTGEEHDLAMVQAIQLQDLKTEFPDIFLLPPTETAEALTSLLADAAKYRSGETRES